MTHLSSYVILYYNVILHYYITTCFLCILVRFQFSQRSERRISRQRVWSWRTAARIWIVAMLIWTSERWGQWSWPRGRTFVVELVYICLYNIEHVITHADVTYGYSRCLFIVWCCRHGCNMYDVSVLKVRSCGLRFAMWTTTLCRADSVLWLSVGSR